MSRFDYIMFPLPLLREVFRKPKTGFRDILSVGIYRTAHTLSVTESDALTQLVYCYYNGGLTDSLQEELDLLSQKGIFYVDEDYRGFDADGYKFDPENEVSSLYNKMEDQEFAHEVLEFHRLRQIKDMLSVTFDISSVAQTYNKYFDAYDGFKEQPLVSINQKTLFDFYQNDKSDYEKALFAMYAGIRSIIGNKEFAETTGNMIKCRMFGAKNQIELERILKDEKIRIAHKKYTTDHHYKKMLKELVRRKFLMSEVGYGRRTYVSCKLDYEKLPTAIVEHKERQKSKSEEKQLQIDKYQAIKEINRRLNKQPF